MSADERKDFLAEMGKRIRQRRISLGYSQEMVALKAGYKSRTTINKLELGKNDISRDGLVKVAEALNKTPAYLAGWEEETNAQIPDGFEPMPKFNTVPLIGEIACGEPILAEQNLAGDARVPENIRADFALVCRGDSMTGAGILDGDIVFIRAQERVENGQIAAVRIGAEATLKRVKIYGKMIVLCAANPAYEDIVLDGTREDIAIEGLAVAFTRVLTSS